VLAKWRYERRAKRAGNQLFLRLLRTPSSVSWFRPGVAFSAPIVIREWPIELFDGARYRLVTDVDMTNAVEALCWWMIATVEQVRNGGDKDAAVAAADVRLSLRDVARETVSPDSEPIDLDLIASAIARLLIGRYPDFHEAMFLIGPNSLISHALAYETGRAAETGQAQPD
jgi:hypothetical protein